MSDEIGRFEWERAIRALPIRPPLRKLIALLLATYANSDGSNIHPGEDRLATEAGVSTRAVREHVAWLRDHAGLVRRTFAGSTAGRRRLADEYQLFLPGNILERIEAAPIGGCTCRSCTDLRNPRSGDDDHRNARSGDRGPISGTPALDHRNPRADHRNDDVTMTGTPVPPTGTSTMDVDHPSPPAGPYRPVPTPTDDELEHARKVLEQHPDGVVDAGFAAAATKLGDFPDPRVLLAAAARWVTEQQETSHG